MEVHLTVVDPARPGSAIDLAVSAGAGTRVEDLVVTVLAAAGAPAGSVLLADDGSPLSPAARLGLPPLVRGAVLAAAPPRPAGAPGGVRPRPAPGFLALHVLAGPDAGHVIGLGPGRHRVGRSGGVQVRLEDPLLSRVHAELEVGTDGVRVRDLGTTNGSRLDGDAVEQEWRPWPAGARLQVGASVLQVRPPVAATVSATPAGDGWVDVNRAPRLAALPEPVVLRLPRPPDPPPPLRLSAVALLLPLALSVPLALLWGPTALLFGLAGPVMTLGTALGDRRGSRREHARRAAAHAAATEEVHREAERRRDAERIVLESQHPDPAGVAATAAALGGRLWERRRDDPDVLAVRLGLGQVRSGVATSEPDDDGPPARSRALVHADAPVVLPLAEVGVLGVSGPRDLVLGAARCLLGQVAVLHSPRDVRVVVLCAEEEGVWRWSRWLPHAEGVGTTGPDAVAVVAALAAEVAGRQEHRPASSSGSVRTSHPRVLVVLDGAERLRGVAGVAQLLADGPAAGVVLVCLDAEPARLPLECAATLAVGGPGGPGCTGAVLSRRGADPVLLQPDLVPARWAARLARALAPLRDAAPPEQGAQLPQQVRLVDLLLTGGTDPGDATAVRAGWARRPRCTAAVLGATAVGPWTVDLRLDGPHVLVAGTTGAGKSELLAALVASLAVGNRPDELSFVLVDYKGGAAFADVAALPHVLGLVTDLDAHLTRRALTSLEAEVRRRERLLSASGCRDLDELLASVDAGGRAGGLGRLVIVVDEFRVLAEELPEFLSGLVRLAAVGRSLGVHLVLATQRPAGVVSADIRANVNLRIALRVRDEADSVDVVEAPDAARIGADHPGRALARTGGGPLVAVQTARVSGRSPAPGEDQVRVERLDAPRSTAPRGPDERAGAEAAGASDLQVLVASVRDAARGLPRPPSPWLPPLPDVLPRSAVLTGTPSGAGGSRSAPGPVLGPVPGPVHGAVHGVVYGLVDVPEDQAQRPLSWALTGPLVVAGGPRSGRTAALRALAAGLSELSPALVHLHVVDGAGGGLADLDGLPHTAAVVARDDGERLLRLLRRLVAEVAVRQTRSADDSDGSTGRTGVGRAPALVLLVDGADRVVAEAVAGTAGPEGDEALGLLQRLVAEGPAVGVVAALAGDRSLLTSRLGSGVLDRLVLAMPDPTDHLLAGLAARDVPESMPPGRGVLLGADGAHEAQVLVLEDDPSAPAQRAAAARLAEEARHRWAEVPASELPAPVTPLPSRLPGDALDAGRAPGRVSGGVPLGVGGDAVQPVALPLHDAPVQLVAGPPGSGRTSTLLALAQRLHAAGRWVVVVAPRRSALSAWATSVVAPLPDPGDAAAVVDALAAARRGGGSGAVVLVDDAELLAGGAVDDALVEHLRAVSAHRGETAAAGALVAAGTGPDLAAAFRGLVPEVRRARCGLLLHPLGASDGDLLGVRLPRTASAAPPGRASLVQRGEVTTVQVALPRSATAAATAVPTPPDLV